MNDRNRLDLRVTLKCLLNLRRLEHLSPGPVDPVQNPADPLDDIAHPVSKNTIDANQHLVSRLDNIDEGRLHARAPGPGNRYRQAVFSPEKPAEHLLYAVHNRQELRIEVADQGLRHSLKDSPMNPGWTRPHEQAPPGIVTAFDHLFRTLYSGGPLSPPASWGPAPELPLLEDE